MPRPDVDTYFMSMARLVATRSTCLRRAVGCVLVNERNHVIATGYNGVAAGMLHCNEPTILHLNKPTQYGNACEGATLPSGEGLDRCQAIHAEQNSLLQCRNVYEIHTCYTTTFPCVTCAKLLMNTSCRRIVYSQWYPGSDVVRSMLEKRGISVVEAL